MRIRVACAAVLLFTVLAFPADAEVSLQETAKSCGMSWKVMPAADKAKTNLIDYVRACVKSGGPSSMAITAKPATASGSMVAPVGNGKQPPAKPH